MPHFQSDNHGIWSESLSSLKMGNVGIKTRSLGQNLEKLCVCLRGHIFSPILMKLGQNVFLDEISKQFENGSCWVKNRSLGQILEKPCALEAKSSVQLS